MATGLLRGELTALLWGGAFTFCWAYVMVARAWTAGSRGVKAPEGRLEVREDRLVFRVLRLPPLPPFFRWSVEVVGVHSPRRRVVQTMPLETVSEMPLAWPRGRYGVEVAWVLEDLFGFTRLKPRHRWTGSVTVEPRPLPFAPPPPPATKAGPWKPRRAGRRTGDPFDVRPYTPGDDLRRLHWPLYAHSGVPFVRTAEPSPPPTGHQFLVLDVDAPSEEDLDERLGRLTSWLAALDEEGSGWTLVIPAAGRTLRSEAGPVLASLSPAPLPDRPPDSGWPETVTLVTGPGSRAIEWAEKTASRRRFRPVVLSSPPAAQGPRAWWRRR